MRLPVRLAALALFIAAALPAAFAQPVDGGHARVELISEREQAIPGETVWFGVHFEMDENWHIYWKNAGDAGIPPDFEWNETSDLQPEMAGDIRWPAPLLLPVVEGEIMDYGYDGEVTIPFPVEIPEDTSGTFSATGVADYLICENICIPEKAAISLTLDIGPTQQPSREGAARITQALETVPRDLDGEARLTETGATWTLSVTDPALAGVSGEARFFPAGHDISHPADQPAQYGPDGLQLELTPSGNLPERLDGVVIKELPDGTRRAVEISATPGEMLAGTTGSGGSGAGAGAGGTIGFAQLVLFALIGGLILNLMPCVLPVLSIKALGMVSAAERGDKGEIRLHGLLYTAGVLASFAALAAAILMVKAATGVASWGFWLQYPLVVTVLILVLFLIGLWLLGLFELGGSLQSVGSGLAERQGPAGAFFTGVLAAIVGAPCTGPFLGVALGAALGRPGLEIFAILMVMGLGLALPFLLLSFMPRLQSALPKPGAWMETLKQVFAFPMFLTAAWLLSVLGALAGFRMAALVVAGCALIAFAVWAMRNVGQGARVILISALSLALIAPVFMLMSASSAIEFVQAAIVFVVLSGAIYAIMRAPDQLARLTARGFAVLALSTGIVWPLTQVTQAAPETGDAASYSASVETEAWSPARVAELTSQGTPVFVDFTAEWCATCQANKLQTLQRPRVQDAFAEAGVAFLVADYTRPDPEIAAELERHGRAGVPMYLWYAPGESEPEVLPELLSPELVIGLAGGS